MCARKMEEKAKEVMAEEGRYRTVVLQNWVFVFLYDLHLSFWDNEVKGNNTERWGEKETVNENGCI